MKVGLFLFLTQKPFLNLLSDYFKEPLGRSFLSSISGLFRFISALLFHLFRHIAHSSSLKDETKSPEISSVILRNKFKTASQDRLLPSPLTRKPLYTYGHSTRCNRYVWRQPVLRAVAQALPEVQPHVVGANTRLHTVDCPVAHRSERTAVDDPCIHCLGRSGASNGIKNQMVTPLSGYILRPTCNYYQQSGFRP